MIFVCLGRVVRKAGYTLVKEFLIHSLTVHLLRRYHISQYCFLSDFVSVGAHLSRNLFFRFIPYTTYVYAKGLLRECIAALTLSTTGP